MTIGKATCDQSMQLQRAHALSQVRWQRDKDLLFESTKPILMTGVMMLNADWTTSG